MRDNELRAKALAWWRSLDAVRQLELAHKWFPDMEFVLVHTSTWKIEEMYIREVVNYFDLYGELRKFGLTSDQCTEVNDFILKNLDKIINHEKNK